MSRESSESDNFSSTKDTKLTEYSRSPDGISDSRSNFDFTASGRPSIKEIEVLKHEGTTISLNSSDEKRHGLSLNTSDEKHQEFDNERTSLSSIKGRLPKDLNRTRKSSANRKASALTSKALPLEGPLTRSRPSQDCLERSSSKLASPLDPLNGYIIRSVSSEDSVQRPSSKMVSTNYVLSEPSTRRLSCVDPLEGPSFRMASYLDPLNGPSTGSVSSVDPLEGPSKKTVWFPDSTDDSLTRICISCHSERETNEPSDSEPPTEPDVSCFRTLTDFLRRSSRQIRRSKCYLLFNVALLALAFSAGYMGSRYDKLCYACPDLPKLVLGMGYFGMVLITFRIASILSKHHFNPPMSGRGLNALLTIVFLSFIPFLMNARHITYSCDPVFTPSKANKKFCVKVFYDYAYYLNAIIPVVIILLMLIHIPGWFDPDEDEEE